MFTALGICITPAMLADGILGSHDGAPNAALARSAEPLSPQAGHALAAGGGPPEPSVLVLLAAGLTGILIRRYRRKPST